MRLHQRPLLSVRFAVAITIPLLLAPLLSACSKTDQSESNAIPSQSLQGNLEQANAETGETSRSIENISFSVPSPADLRVTNLRAGYVSLAWMASSGDLIQHQPGQDTVSYYRVYRNGELLKEAFSTFIEDVNPIEGNVVYAVQAVKFESSPEFSIAQSALVEIDVYVPTIKSESEQLGGVNIDEASFINTLDAVKTCSTVQALADGSSLCSNHTGQAWYVSATGEPGELLPQTSGVGTGLVVNANSRDAELGPIPALPDWSVTQLGTGATTFHDLGLEAELQAGERYLVNGVVVSEQSTVYISGTLYQSYIPRSLGPAPGVLPITNGYYVAQYNLESTKLVGFRRFSLEEAPGVAASIYNGHLQMLHTGLITLLDTATLASLAQQRVAGLPLFSTDEFIYTSSGNAETSTDYYRFSL